MQNIIQYILKDQSRSNEYPYVLEIQNNKVKTTCACVSHAKRFSKADAISMCVQNDDLILIEEVCRYTMLEVKIELKESVK